MSRERQCSGAVFIESDMNRLALSRDRSLPIIETSLQKHRVQLIQITDSGNRSRPFLFQPLDQVLIMRLLVPPGGHAEQRLKVEVTG